MLLNKRILSVLLFACFILNAAFGAIDADVGITTYYQNEKPYIDVSLHIVGSTLKSKDVGDNLVETRVKVLMTIEQNGQIIDFQKYGLVSPTSKNPSDFIDLRRFVLNPGTYTINIELIDQLNSKNQFQESIPLEVSLQPDGLSVSKLSLIASAKPSTDEENPFFKYGNILEPAAFGFFHEAMDKLFVFGEIYNADQVFNGDFAVRVLVFNNDEEQEVIKKFKRLKPSNQAVYMDGFPIGDLPSGNYKIQFDLVDANQESQYSQTIYFQRSNPSRDVSLMMNNDLSLEGSFVNKLTPEELEYNLKALVPRLNQMEISTINIMLADENVKGQRFYLYNYWTQFDPVTTEETFNTYNNIAKAVDRMFYNTVGRGFETDRGYIFLKYGKPKDIITVENEPSAPPYEIWFYDKLDLTGETNMKFLFYNPTLGGNDFTLLHSTSRFERRNPRWEVELYSDAPNEIEGNRIDATTVGDGLNRRAREYFEDNN